MKLNYIIFRLLIISILFGCNNQNKTLNLKDGLLIENGTIITPDSIETVHVFKGYVVLEGDSIVYVAKEKPTLTGNYKIKDARNKYVIPGLIDSHVHVGHPIGISDADYENMPELVESYFNQLPKSYLYFGYTTLIDYDLKEQTKKRFNESEIKPLLYGAGRGIRYFNGYGQTLFPKPLRYKIFPNWVFDESQKSDLSEDIDFENHTVEKAVKKSLESNAICIKTYYEDGFGGTFNWPVPSDSLLTELVTQAHNNNLPVALHSTSASAYKAGLKAGVDIFAHGLWHWKGEPLDANPTPEIHEILEQVALQKKYMQLTTRVLYGEYDDYTWERINDIELPHVLPSILIKHLKTNEGQFAKREITETYNQLKPDKTISNEAYFKFGIDKINNVVKLAQKYGVKMIFGTDTPSAAGIGNVPGYNGFLEMQSLVKLGINLEEIFIASTIRNARAFNLDKKIGSISPSKVANLLILNQNPLNNINAYNAIEQIIIKGKLIERNELIAK